MIRTRAVSFVLALMSALAITAQVTIADAGPDQYLCSTNAFLQGNAVALGEVGSWSIVSGVGTIDDVDDPNSQITAQGPGVIVLRWTITAGTETSTDQVAIWIYDGSAPPASAGFDITVVLPQTSVQLQGSPYTLPMTCLWTVVQGSGTIADPTDPFTMATGLNVGTNIFMWSCDNGPCGSTSDMVDITVEDAMAIQKERSVINARAWFDASADRVAVVADRLIERLVFVDASGRVVLDRSMNAGSASFDVSHLSIGAFVVRMSLGDSALIQRFAILR